MKSRTVINSVGRVLLGLLACLLVFVILWLDITTGIWQDLVILSGLAAGLVSFVFTALVLNRIMVKNAAHRWSTVNRLAFSDFLHALADENESEIARGKIVARSLGLPSEVPPPVSGGGSAPLEMLRILREQIVFERESLSSTLSRWAQFLASSGDNDSILQHLASIAWQFDVVRDAALDAERAWTTETRALLIQEVDTTNSHLAELARELQVRLRK